MPRRSLRFVAPVVASLVVFFGWAAPRRLIAQEDAAQKHSQARIRTLIGMLASTNKAPDAKEGRLSVPKDYDTGAQAVVYLAAQQLLSEGSPAFDLLIEHFDDDEYSYSYESPVGRFNRTVGDVCWQILTRVV